MNTNLEYYKIFYYVGRCKGITLAAKELCISQPAVSQGIKQLEQEIGAPLFTRTPKGVLFTQTGEVLYRYVSRGYEAILEGERKISELINMEYGEVRIGASDMTLQFYLLPYLERFHQVYPNIKVSVTNAPTPKTLEHLYAGRIDFGVVTTPFDKKDRLDVTNAREIEDIFVAGHRFKELQGKELDYKDLNNLPIICLENMTSTRVYVDDFLAKQQVKLKPEFELATSDMIVQFVRRNLGIGSVMKDFALPYIESGDIFELKLKKIPSRQMCVISDNRAQMSVAGTKLLEMLRE